MFSNSETTDIMPRFNLMIDKIVEQIILLRNTIQDNYSLTQSFDPTCPNASHLQPIDSTRVVGELIKRSPQKRILPVADVRVLAQSTVNLLTYAEKWLMESKNLMSTYMSFGALVVGSYVISSCVTQKLQQDRLVAQNSIFYLINPSLPEFDNKMHFNYGILCQELFIFIIKQSEWFFENNGLFENIMITHGLKENYDVEQYRVDRDTTQTNWSTKLMQQLLAGFQKMSVEDQFDAIQNSLTKVHSIDKNPFLDIFCTTLLRECTKHFSVEKQTAFALQMIEYQLSGNTRACIETFNNTITIQYQEACQTMIRYITILQVLEGWTEQDTLYLKQLVDNLTTRFSLHYFFYHQKTNESFFETDTSESLWAFFQQPASDRREEHRYDIPLHVTELQILKSYAAYLTLYLETKACRNTTAASAATENAENAELENLKTLKDYYDYLITDPEYDENEEALFAEDLFTASENTTPQNIYLGF